MLRNWRARLSDVREWASTRACPDCASEITVAELLLGVLRLLVLHDDTCPWLCAQQGGRKR